MKSDSNHNIIIVLYQKYIRISQKNEGACRIIQWSSWISLVHSLFVPYKYYVIEKSDWGEPIPLFIDRHTLHIRTHSLHFCEVRIKESNTQSTIL